MKFGKMIQLWITGLILLASASAYAADCFMPTSPDKELCNYLTISPAGDAPGMYEVRIFGSSDTDKEIDIAGVTTSVIRTDIRFRCVEEASEDAISRCVVGDYFLVEARLKKGTKPGRNTYEKKFKVFLEEGVYILVFQASDNYGRKFDGKVSSDNCNEKAFLSVPPPQTPVSLNLQNAAAEITGTDSFTLRNLGAELGSGEKFSAWGKFQWNPSTLSWTLKDAGVEK